MGRFWLGKFLLSRRFLAMLQGIQRYSRKAILKKNQEFYYKGLFVFFEKGENGSFYLSEGG